VPPARRELAGTDQLARPAEPVIYGARPTLLIVLLVALPVRAAGLLFGICAGWFGGWVIVVLMPSLTSFSRFPRLVLALALVAVLRTRHRERGGSRSPSPPGPRKRRIARTETLTCRGSDFMQAARVQGLPTPRILWATVAMCLPSTVVRVTLDMAGIILTAPAWVSWDWAHRPPMSEWGAMIAAGRQFIFDQWWVAVCTGMAILFGSLASNLVATACATCSTRAMAELLIENLSDAFRHAHGRCVKRFGRCLCGWTRSASASSVNRARASL
jgi:peptide/nickel transport system permease protein